MYICLGRSFVTENLALCLSTVQSTGAAITISYLLIFVSYDLSRFFSADF